MSPSRKAVLSALDTLVGFGDSGWQGNVSEVWMEIRRQGYGNVSDGVIRKILRESGVCLRRGQFRVTRAGLEKR